LSVITVAVHIVFNHKFTYSTQASTGPVASDLAMTSPYFTRSQAHKFYIYESDEDETTDGPPTATNVGHFSQKNVYQRLLLRLDVHRRTG